MRLEDKEAIRELILRWCRAIDRLDLEAIRAVFHPEAHDDHGTFKGGVQALIDWIDGRHKAIPFSMHSVTNCLIDFQGEDQALVETYCIAYQKYPAAAKPNLEALVGPLDIDADCLEMTVLCRYLDTVTRRDGAWKILHRLVVLDNVTVQPGFLMPDPTQIGWAVGRRKGHSPTPDPVFTLLDAKPAP